MCGDMSCQAISACRSAPGHGSHLHNSKRSAQSQNLRLWLTSLRSEGRLHRKCGDQANLNERSSLQTLTSDKGAAQGAARQTEEFQTTETMKELAGPSALESWCPSSTILRVCQFPGRSTPTSSLWTQRCATPCSVVRSPEWLDSIPVVSADSLTIVFFCLGRLYFLDALVGFSN